MTTTSDQAAATDGSAPLPVPPRSRGKASAGKLPRVFALAQRPETCALLGTMTVYLFFVIFAGHKGFLTLNGTAGWLNVAAELGIIAVPAGILMISGEFDLSVASTLACASVITAIGTTNYGLPVGASIAVALLFSLVVGFVNGTVVRRTRLPSFIVTLAMLFALQGLSLGLTRTITGGTTPDVTTTGLWHDAFAASWHTFNISIIWWTIVIVVASWLLGQTRFGNWVFAIGGDVQAARSAGIRVHRVKTALFMATAFGAGLVGVIQTLEFNGSDVSTGQGYVFDVIIAAVVGGVLLTGGYGSAIGVTLGAMTFGIASVGVFYTGWDTDYTQLVLGLLLLAAVLANNLFRRLALRRAS